MNTFFELNLDGLVGPTHHYAGLATGNIASHQHQGELSNPQEAAIQGLDKMYLLHQLGFQQGFLPPHERPNLRFLKQLGFTGTPEQCLRKAYRADPKLLSACYAAASMWTANMATVTPSVDSPDGRLHFTPANLISQYHRHQEAAFSSYLLKRIFHDPQYFMHHQPLPGNIAFRDEGAANHHRLCATHASLGYHLFVYGAHGLRPTPHHPQNFPARQTKEASEAIARQHGLPSHRVFFAQQNPQAIDLGVFHHDIIGLGNESLLILHEQALYQQKETLSRWFKTIPHDVQYLEVPSSLMSLEEAVKSYFFNAQLLTQPDCTGMLLLAPEECQQIPCVQTWINIMLEKTPLQAVQYVRLNQSMHNGGGPACLRLRVPISNEALMRVHPEIMLSEAQYQILLAWIKKYYRTQISYQDLLDPHLIDESYRALDELTQYLALGALYPFQLNAIDE